MMLDRGYPDEAIIGILGGKLGLSLREGVEVMHLAIKNYDATAVGFC